MDYYPQPRPVLYGTRDTESSPQTQIAPVRTGPPRYPPAPPLASYGDDDAPDPHDQPPRIFIHSVHKRAKGAMLFVVLYSVGSAYSLLQVLMGKTGFANPIAGQVALLSEIIIDLIVTACLLWLGGREYLLALGLVGLHICVGVVLGQWQSPALWVAIAVLLYLVRPTIRKRYTARALAEIRNDVTRSRYSRGHARHTARHAARHRSRSNSQDFNPDYDRKSSTEEIVYLHVPSPYL